MNFDDWSWIIALLEATHDAIVEGLFRVATLTACEMTAYVHEVGYPIAADMTFHVNACDFASLESLFHLICASSEAI